ncbi:MAG TPA: TolC family protein [Thermoanaerobaculia bacterium]|nr:TolC family protein [Thermoanaerobaculia bacterium]
MFIRSAVGSTVGLFLLIAPLARPGFGGQEPPRLEDLLTRARASAEELAISSELAAARRELGATSARFAAGPTLGVETGPRRTNGSTDADLAIDLDLPLLGKGNGREEALAALERAGARLPAAARLETRGRIATAYVAAWAAEREALLRGEDVATVERWLKIAQRRLEQGAEAAFEVDLVAFDLEQARAARAEALAARAAGWAELAVWVETPLDELPAAGSREEIAEPPPPDLPPDADLGTRFESSPLGLALAARRDLSVALARFDLSRSQSRWALRSSLAREADESVARFGLAYRFPLAAERPAADQALAASMAAAQGQADQSLAELRSRFASARSRFLALSAFENPPPDDLSPERTLAAIELRLTEGKARPSEVLLQRRAVISAELARIQRRAALWAASWELATLTAEVLP